MGTVAAHLAGWPTFALAALAPLAAADIARKIADRYARARHWRVGPFFGPILCIWHRTGSTCLRCHTDWRWARPHDIPIAKEGGLCIFPMCQSCWEESDRPERLTYCSELMNAWVADGRYGDGRRFDQARWDEERIAIFSAVEAGL